MDNIEPVVELGDKVREIIMGIEGIVVTRTQHLTGCDRVGIQAEKLSLEGKIQTYNVDVTELVILEKGAFQKKKAGMLKSAMPMEQTKQQPGGPPTRTEIPFFSGD